MRTREIFLTSCLSFLLIGFLFAQDVEEKVDEKKLKSYEFALRFDYMFTKGTISYEDWKTDLSIDFPEEGETNASLSPTISAGMEIGKNHLFFGFNYVTIKANGVTPSVNIFNPENSPPIIIPKGTKMRSDINMNVYSLIWTRTVFNKKVHELGIGAGLMFIDYKLNYSLEGYVETGEFSQVYPAPMLSFHYTLELKRFELQTLAGGVGANINGNAIAYMNLDVAARYKLFSSNGWFGMLSFGLKYVPFYMSFETDEFTYENNMKLFGPFLGLRLKKLR